MHLNIIFGLARSLCCCLEHVPDHTDSSHLPLIHRKKYKQGVGRQLADDHASPLWMASGLR